MHSSDTFFLIRVRVQWFFVLCCILLGACAALPVPFQNKISSNAHAVCEIHRGSESGISQNTSTTEVLQRMVESSLLYQQSASVAKLASCQIWYDAAVITIKYQFQDGGWLHVKRDMRIEYSEQEAQFVSPIKENPIKILTDLEYQTFGEQGCGIDWQHSESQLMQETASLTEAIFYGDTCNCQARIRRNANGDVVGLLMRSAC